MHATNSPNPTPTQPNEPKSNNPVCSLPSPPFSSSLLPFHPMQEPHSVGACVNKKLTLSPLCVLRIASASVGLISITLNLSHLSPLSPNGTVFVTTTLLNLLLFSVSIAFPDKIPCVTIATTSRALCAMTVSAALTSVPHVSAMSSTRIAILFSTSPTRTMRETSLGRARSLWMRAKPRSRRSAMDVALHNHQPLSSLLLSGEAGNGNETYRFAPPASGLTTTQSSTLKFSRIHRSVLGSAYRLSTGTLKNPWIWLACRSIVITWLHPAVCSILAISFALIGALLLSFLSWRA